MTRVVAPDRWLRRQRADERARTRRITERLAASLDRPLQPWQTDMLAAALLAAAGGLSPLEAYAQRQAITIALMQGHPRSLVILSGC